MTGTLTIQKPYIDWKENNTFTVVVEPKGCTLDKFKWTMSGNGGSITMPPAGAADNGWYKNTSGNTNGYLFTFNNALKQYPGSIQSGKVTVTFTALDSCGTESVIGPKDFEIGSPPPNNPPELRVSFTNASGEEIGQAIVVDTMMLRVFL
ncbi:hypothetical protein [Paenibacillus naphthalenovorans]|uniref:hypothetical protein n=1 Tax=Paenibacillus naphthalenovorans TaxID=162209 RepID=UPI0008839855|nr:hypothetical protein [Paenibacillus naphthalenovorans]SDI97263.1 hypothetical protein SAMN05421868_11421 [Paenibacillus naphthalenovorans]